MRNDFSCMDDSIGAVNAAGCLQSQTDWHSAGDLWRDTEGKED